MKPYAAHGKQVQRNGEHVADAADETWAQIIADALNNRRRDYGTVSTPVTFAGMPAQIDPSLPPDTVEFRHPGGRVDTFDYAREPDKTTHMIYNLKRGPTHTWQRQQDEYACSCGARWDVADGDEHPS